MTYNLITGFVNGPKAIGVIQKLRFAICYIFYTPLVTLSNVFRQPLPPISNAYRNACLEFYKN